MAQRHRETNYYMIVNEYNKKHSSGILYLSRRVTLKMCFRLSAGRLRF
jgi:hypothetical protein